MGVVWTLCRRFLVVVACTMCLISGSVQEFVQHDTPRVKTHLDVNACGLEPVEIRDVTLREKGFKMVFAKRLAGAVYSLEWEGHTIVPKLEGNGGSLQTALAFDIVSGESSETENPTEAGSVFDSYGKTSSAWIATSVSDAGDEIYTKSRMAYWYPPGHEVMNSGMYARGTLDDYSGQSDVILRKRVRVEENVIRYKIKLTWTEDHFFTQIQILALYVAREFDRVYTVHNGQPRRHTGGVPAFSTSPPEKAYPIIVAKSRHIAVGMVVLSVPPSGRFPGEWQPWYTVGFSGGHKDFGNGLEPVDLTGVSSVFHMGDPEGHGKGGGGKNGIPLSVHFECALVFGSVNRVAEKIKQLQVQWR